ncbi:rhodanese-like domain-containing protein [Brevifollis gellanilyticus]|uniref:rhodanese-like domain-containing protein n=1 Tax=Brevifollis gellanilyticus TaxID=748831 RepID=UPI0011BE1EF8|nr:rhodanese-like domain-containing protein [Brevifollis gellanilyticus]
MSSALFQACLIVLLAAAAATAAFQVHPRAPALYAVQEPLKADEVGLKEIQERWKGDVIWLDARPRDQFDKDHIPNARLLNEQEFDTQLFDLLETLQTATKPIIIYCSGQKCEASRHVREKLLATVPIDNCFILKGGYPTWQAAQKAR